MSIPLAAALGVNRTQRKAHYDMPVTVGLSVGVALIRVRHIDRY